MGILDALVVVTRVEEQLPDEEPVLSGDADLEVGNEDANGLALVGPTDANVE